MVIFRDQSLFENHDEQSDDNRKSSRYKFLISSIILVIVLSAFFGTILKDFYYVDIPNLCFIKTSYSVHNKEKSYLHEAIKTLKIKDIDSYSDLCNYVAVISETNCIIAYETGPIIEYSKNIGCYIKGTKTVFIQPLNTNTKTPTNEEIAESLKRYAGLSKTFWATYQ